jgi:hypothetical protein
VIKRVSGFAGCLLAAGALAGCGGAGSIARIIGVAACRQAASSLTDPQARQIADQACQVGYSGSVQQATQAAEQTARNTCLAEASRIVDPVARQQVAGLCPAGK